MRDALSEHNVPMLEASVMNRALLFLASPASDGLTGEKIVGKDFDDWLRSRNIAFDD
jgi:gluconate 5-dehydrogenase